ncbi:hypothetical protein Q7P37_001277 [Cladosporium fusiforme]
MPIIRNFAAPRSISQLEIPANSAFFIAFLASKDPTTQRPWCPDVVAALPTLEATFQGGNAPTVAFVEVGQRPEWKDSKNVFRTNWNVNNVPALVRFEKAGDTVKEIGRLIEGEILDEERRQQLLR